MSYIYEIFSVGFYIIIGLALIGVIVILFGAYKGNRDQIRGGLLAIAAAAVIGICGYIMYSQTEEKANYFMEKKMEDYYEQ